ncbi:MAG: hypothetical protein ACYC7A_20615 [Thermoanaerobaculia bacterium]
MIVLFMAGWTYAAASIYDRSGALPPASGAPTGSVVSQITGAVLEPAATTTPFLNEAALEFLDPLRGESGKVQMALRRPGEPLAEDSPEGVAAEYVDERGKAVIAPGLTAPDSPGVYKIALALNQARTPVDDFSLITLVPFSEKKKGKIGLYFLGSWPYETGGRPRSARYSAPVGFIEVTQQNKDVRVSEHFRLGDFLTKDQKTVWPKYLLLDPALLDKLELTIAELEKRGIDVENVTVMSGFRTPRYNVAGGNTEGRANLSRHMYGDGADVFVDNDRNGVLDDLNGNGRSDTKDAEIMALAAETVERAEPSLVGGIGIYPTCCGHGPFVHIDVRGYRARWRGSGNG